MPTVHLTAPDADRVVPGRVDLGLDELLLLAERAGDLRLPLDLEVDASADRLAARLAGDGLPPADEAHALLAAELAASASEETADRLAEAGLLVDGLPVAPLGAALETLGSPEALLVLDLGVSRASGPVRLRSWFAIRGGRVGQLSTVDGLRHELGWYDVRDLHGALARAATLEELPAGSGPPAVPDLLRLPYETLTAGLEAVRRGRDDLLAEVVRVRPEPVTVAGEPLADNVVRDHLRALQQRSLGRLRVMVTAAPVQGEPRRAAAGVVSWLLLDRGWLWLEPRSDGQAPAVVVHAVQPGDLGRVLGPVVSEVL